MTTVEALLKQLADPVADDIAALQARVGGLPAYAGARAKPWFPARSAYNWTESSTRALRAALAQYDTNRVLLSVLGHSLAAGGGDSTVGTQDLAARIRRYLQSVGAASGTGLVIIDQNVGGVRDSRLSFTGTWTASGNDSDPYVYTFAANQEILLQADVPGTIVDVVVSNNTAQIEIYVNDYLVDTYTGPNVGSAATAFVTRSFSGLAFHRHKVRVKSMNTSGAVVHAIRVRNATGLEVSNVGRGGAEVADWINSTYNTNYPALVHTGLPNVAILSIGANEALSGTAVATMKTDYTTFLTALQAAGVACIMLTEVPPPTSGAAGFFVTQANWNAYMSAYYDLADTFNVPLVDSTHAFGSAAIAATLGMISADALHPNRKGYAMQTEVLLASLLEYMNLRPGTDVADLAYAPALGRPQNLQTGATYTLVAADIRKMILTNRSGGTALTIPSQASVPIPLDTEIYGANIGASGTTVLTADTGVTFVPATPINVAAGASWAIKKVEMPNKWLLMGKLS